MGFGGNLGNVRHKGLGVFLEINRSIYFRVVKVVKGLGFSWGGGVVWQPHQLVGKSHFRVWMDSI